VHLEDVAGHVAARPGQLRESLPPDGPAGHGRAAHAAFRSRGAGDHADLTGFFSRPRESVWDWTAAVEPHRLDRQARGLRVAWKQPTTTGCPSINR
jgi:hypothetical protein